jgi:hypothetical protein
MDEITKYRPIGNAVRMPECTRVFAGSFLVAACLSSDKTKKYYL